MSESREYATLLNCTEKLKLALSAYSGLLHSLYMNGLVTKELRDELNNPRSMISKQQKTDNLVEGIQNAVKLDSDKYHEFIEILGTNMRENGSIYNILTKEYSKIRSPAASPVPTAAKTRPTSTASDTNKAVLKEEHWGKLSEQLNSCAGKWSAIATNLGFTRGEVEIIQANAMNMTGGPAAYLRNMLGDYLHWAPGDARGSKDFATLKALKDAVSRAGFGTTALSLKVDGDITFEENSQSRISGQKRPRKEQEEGEKRPRQVQESAGQNDSTPDGGEPASSPTPSSTNPVSTEREEKLITGGKMNSEQLAKWLLKEGIDEKDVKILKERGINERQFMKLHEKSEKLKDISDSTIDDLEDLQKDLSERHQRTN